MNEREAVRMPALLERTALFLAVLGILLRWLVCGATAGPGINLSIHLLFWLSLAACFLGKALVGGTWRFTSLEFAGLGFMIACLLSVQRASFKLAALEQAMSLMTWTLLLVIAVNVLGRTALLSLVFPALSMLAVYALLQYFILFPIYLEVSKAPGSQFGEEMIRRIQTFEVYASFIGPNQLAGFLVIVLPIGFGILMDARPAGPRALLPRGAALILGFMALLLTGSRGGWVSLAAAAGAFAVLRLTRSRGRGFAVGSAAAAVAVITILLLFTPLLGKLADRNHSMHVRQVYWQAAGKVIAQAPFLGVGLDNWQDRYYGARSEVQQETHRVHNDYLQFLADAGLVGLLAFAALVAMALRRGLRREETPAPPGPALPGWLMPAAALVALPWAWAAGAFPTELQLLIGCFITAVWLGVGVLERRTRVPEALPWTRLGAAAAVGAGLVHMTVDFDLYEMGTAMTVFLSLGLAVVLEGGAAEVRLPRAAWGAAAAITLAVALPLLAFVAPRLIAAEGEQRDSRDPRTAPADAVRLAEAARRRNPIDPELYVTLSHARFQEWLGRRRAALENLANLEEAQVSEEASLMALEDAIRLRPDHSVTHAEKADLHRRFKEFYVELRTGQAVLDARGEMHLREAIYHQREAQRLYPAIWVTHYGLARLLDMAGQGDEARGHYREALRLGELSRREIENLERLRPHAFARARCLLREGGEAGARAALAAGIRKELEGLNAAESRIRLQDIRSRRSVPDGSPDEWDDLMRPVIEGVLDDMIRSLPR